MTDAARAFADESIVELALRKVGQLTCRHRHEQLVKCQGRMFVRCNDCGRETQGFRVHAAREVATS